MMFYIGSNRELPLVPRREGENTVCVEELSPREEVVRRTVGLPHVRYVGSHEGCGCGFLHEPDLNPEDVPQVLQSLGQLADYIDRQLKLGCRVRLFCTWDGDQDKGTNLTREVFVSKIRSGEYFLECGELLELKADV
jgi:hypothetical protein